MSSESIAAGAAVAVAATHSDMSIFGLIASADIICKLVMLALVAASVWSWTIIINKYKQFKIVKSKMANFEGVFWSGQPLDGLYDRVKRSVDNPLSAAFVAAMNECKRNDSHSSTNSALKIGLKERIMQSMNLVRNRETEQLEENLGFLATVGSAGPFVGLFGTVWGIMNSFQSIALSKNTSLAVVAPGIAEALLATAIGLVAAIPAVICYNFLAAQVSTIGSKLDDFIGELYTILARAIDEEKL
ncbi:MAG: protein TolQ [Rickettsiaceae bacterium]|nr:protein TolQ [Rickettsiaceae bacterium]